jgi:hypothetical protein
MTKPLVVLSTKEIVCPYCYLAHQLTVLTDPRIPTPGMLWLCNECKDLSVFDEHLDLREATPEEKAKAVL